MCIYIYIYIYICAPEESSRADVCGSLRVLKECCVVGGRIEDPPVLGVPGFGIGGLFLHMPCMRKGFFPDMPCMKRVYKDK